MSCMLAYWMSHQLLQPIQGAASISTCCLILLPSALCTSAVSQDSYDSRLHQTVTAVSFILMHHILPFFSLLMYTVELDEYFPPSPCLVTGSTSYPSLLSSPTLTVRTSHPASQVHEVCSFVLRYLLLPILSLFPSLFVQGVATTPRPTIGQLRFRLVAEPMERKIRDWRSQAGNSTFARAHPTLAKSMWILPRLELGAEDLDGLEEQQRCALCYLPKEFKITKVTFFGEWGTAVSCCVQR